MFGLDPIRQSSLSPVKLSLQFVHIDNRDDATAKGILIELPDRAEGVKYLRKSEESK